jgi:hypothetical protein
MSARLAARSARAWAAAAATAAAAAAAAMDAAAVVAIEGALRFARRGFDTSLRSAGAAAAAAAAERVVTPLAEGETVRKSWTLRRRFIHVDRLLRTLVLAVRNSGTTCPTLRRRLRNSCGKKVQNY